LPWRPVVMIRVRVICAYRGFEAVNSRVIFILIEYCLNYH
jgi:hypothetical protein